MRTTRDTGRILARSTLGILLSAQALSGFICSSDPEERKVECPAASLDVPVGGYGIVAVACPALDANNVTAFRTLGSPSAYDERNELRAQVHQQIHSHPNRPNERAYFVLAELDADVTEGAKITIPFEVVYAHADCGDEGICRGTGNVVIEATAPIPEAERPSITLETRFDPADGRVTVDLRGVEADTRTEWIGNGFTPATSRPVYLDHSGHAHSAEQLGPHIEDFPGETKRYTAVGWRLAQGREAISIVSTLVSQGDGGTQIQVTPVLLDGGAIRRGTTVDVGVEISGGTPPYSYRWTPTSVELVAEDHIRFVAQEDSTLITVEARDSVGRGASGTLDVRVTDQDPELLELCSDIGDQLAEPMQLVQLCVVGARGDSVEWFVAGEQSGRVVGTGEWLDVLATRTRTYIARVRDGTRVMREGQLTVHVAPATLPTSIEEEQSGRTVTFRALGYGQGGGLVPIGQAHDIVALEWFILEEDGVEPIDSHLESRSGPDPVPSEFTYTFQSAGAFWVYYRAIDGSGNFGIGQTALDLD